MRLFIRKSLLLFGRILLRLALRLGPGLLGRWLSRRRRLGRQDRLLFFRFGRFLDLAPNGFGPRGLLGRFGALGAGLGGVRGVGLGGGPRRWPGPWPWPQRRP